MKTSTSFCETTVNANPFRIVEQLPPYLFIAPSIHRGRICKCGLSANSFDTRKEFTEHMFVCEGGN